MTKKRTRNFSIIAHIDHGKSTLADRLLEFTGAVSSREMKQQVLDKMDLERERGITIKAQHARLTYKADDGNEYTLNLIDTPGHVDFGYEVSRSLAACEGALLVVDAAQGVEAQTLANVYLALENNLEIIPVLNKIDLPSAEPERVKEEIEETIGLDASDAIPASAKDGIGTKEILEAIVNRVPPPGGVEDAPLKALVVDSWFDAYRGVVVMVRIFDGFVKKGRRVKLVATGNSYDVIQVGSFFPVMREVSALHAGDVGYIIAGIKEISETRIGDTITDEKHPTSSPCHGFKELQPMVFSGLYPVDSNQYPDLKEALKKLKLNDSSFTYSPETSLALGFGFRCGFLGLLHMEIVQERLEREYNLNLLSTAPSVAYRVNMKNGDVTTIENPVNFPPVQQIDFIEEPYITASIHSPSSYVGGILKLCQDKRGVQKNIQYLSRDRVIIHYDIPLNEVVMDFYDKLKSISKGYASLDYQMSGFMRSTLVKLDILINGEPVDALSLIVHKDKAYFRGKDLAEKMKELIPRQMFEVVIQAAIGTKVVARETVKALRKNVTAKCYGGDITRKRKLIEKQKEGKKRMKQVGKIDLPQEVFLAALKID